MKWFKHHNDLLSKSDMQILLDNHGLAGPYAFIRLLEIFAEDFNVDMPGVFITSKRKIFKEIFPTVCPKTGKKILEFFQAVGWLKFKIYGKEIIFECKIIKELADEYTQRIIKEREQKEDKRIGTNSRYGIGTSYASSSKRD